MKRSAGSDFDDSGEKWFQSPQYKELKMDPISEEAMKGKDMAKRFPKEFEKETKIKKERFYDIFSRVTRDEDFKLDIEELNRTLNIKIEDIPDNYKVSAIFEDLNSKSSVISRGKKNWSEQETMLCIWLVIAFSTLEDKDYNNLSDKDWDVIGKIFPGKTADQCKVRWQSLLKTNLAKAPWTQDEDNLLSQIIKDKGPKKWKEIAYELNKKMEPNKVFRQGKQCRERWINHLDPAINRGAWSADEDVQLLEVHLQVGKKWAEIAKILKNRTENAVKNRWNSLIKKYRAEYGIDFDTLSNSSAFSNQSMEDLERRVAEMIITNRKKKNPSDGSSPDTISHNPIYEIPEEESPGYYSDYSLETGKTNDGFGSATKREEESEKSDMKNGQKKGMGGGKKKGNTSVSLAKNNLMGMVSEEIRIHDQPFPQKGPLETIPEDPMGQNNNNSSQQLFLFGNNNNNNNGRMNNGGGNYGDSMINNPMSLFGPVQTKNSPGPSNYNYFQPDFLGLNMWRNNLNNLNVFGQAPQQDLLGQYNSQNNMQQQQQQQQQNNYGIASASLGYQGNNQGVNGNLQQNNTNQQQQDSEKLLKLNDANGQVQGQVQEQEQEPRTFNLTKRPIEQLNVNETNQNQLFYAIVDLSGNQMYLMEPIHKDNFPPNFLGKSKNSTQSTASLNNIDGIIANSPSMNHASWTSPQLNPAALMNYPLFNNPLSFGFGKSFSPNINLFQESPKLDRNLFTSTPKMEGSDWTPENFHRPLFANLTMKQRMGLANSIGETPPDAKIGAGNGAFLRRINERPQTGQPTEPGMKYNSPSSFLQSSSYMGRNKA